MKLKKQAKKEIYTVDTEKKLVTLELYTADFGTIVTTAKCSDRDEFKPEVGRAIAKTRAIIELKKKMLPLLVEVTKRARLQANDLEVLTRHCKRDLRHLKKVVRKSVESEGTAELNSGTLASAE